MIAEAPAGGAVYELHPRQHQAMWLLGLDVDAGVPEGGPVEELFFGGAAGGGKSRLMRVVAAAVAQMWPGSHVGLFRRRRTELFATHKDALLKEVPGALVSYKGDPEYEFRWRNGSVTTLCFCDHEDDIYGYGSYEFDAMLFDEATQFTRGQYTYLRSRCRSTRPGWRRLLLAAANPGGPGHEYFREHFVDGARPGEIFLATDIEGGAKPWPRCFLPARLADNPSLSEEDYMASLQGISDPVLRDAMANGNWNLHAGQMFTEWRRDGHTCEEFEVPPEWVRWGGLDYGYSDPTVYLGFARVPAGYELPIREERYRVSDRPRVLIHQELYRKETVAQLCAWQILMMGGGRQRGPIWADPSMWNRLHDGSNIAGEYAAVGVNLTRGNNDRIAGVGRMHRALLAHEGQPPELVVMMSCPYLIRTLPNLPRDKHNPEDVDSGKDDHGYDGARYGLMGGARKGKAATSGRYRIGTGNG